MTNRYDGIILGAGHNGLILQAYLGRAGLKTICLERRDVAGGGLATVQFPDGSGFWHNTHSFFHRGATHLPWYRELELETHGATYIEPQLNVTMICSDGRALEWWTDFERTVDSFARFSLKDADALRRWRDDFRPIVQEILVPESESPPLPLDQRERKLRQTAEGRLMLEVSRLSPVEYVRREFEHPTIQAGLLFFNGLREVDLRLPGFGHHIPALLASDRMAQMCAGGTRQLTAALVSAVTESGGEVKLGTTPRRILVDHGRAVGVETYAGDVIHATDFVVSSLNPQQTFLELIDQQHVPAEWRAKAGAYRYNLLAPLFSLNVNLREAPAYAAARQLPQLNNAFMVILGLDTIDRFAEIVSCHEAGRIPPTVMWGSCPSQFDPSQAPGGYHTAFMWEKVPYRLHGDPRRWDEVKGQHGRELLQTWGRYAPNLSDALIDSFTHSPLETERTLPNMTAGDLLVGSFAGGQVGYHRPFRGAGHYRGYLEGLYLCGSCCHPGGNITGLPGHNCAKVLLADLGLRD